MFLSLPALWKPAFKELDHDIRHADTLIRATRFYPLGRLGSRALSRVRLNSGGPMNDSESAKLEDVTSIYFPALLPHSLINGMTIEVLAQQLGTKTHALRCVTPRICVRHSSGNQLDATLLRSGSLRSRARSLSTWRASGPPVSGRLTDRWISRSRCSGSGGGMYRPIRAHLCRAE
jgi:hypothetical protein